MLDNFARNADNIQMVLTTMIAGTRVPRWKALLPVLCFLCLVPAPASARGAAVELEALLGSPAVTYAQASRFVLEAADVRAFDDPAEAFLFAMSRGYLPGNAAPDAPARLDGVSLLLVRSFGLGGGIMFSITGSPHFAYRELEHMGFISGRAGPRMAVSGETLLYLTGRALAHLGE